MRCCETAPQHNSGPDIGDNERFDHVAHRVRAGAWMLVVPALIIAAFTFETPDHSVPSTVLRAAIIYGFVLLVIRLAGKRTLAELSTFDLVVILIISEAVQPALTADDTRLTSTFLLVLTIVAVDLFLGVLTHKWHPASALLDDVPTVLVRDGRKNNLAMKRERIEDDDTMEAARRQLGIERFSDIRFAVLERTGGISVIPWMRNDGKGLQNEADR